mgnify:CR=1 FL=1
MSTLASKGQLRASFLRWALFTVPACILLGFFSGQIGEGPGSIWFQTLEKPSIYPDPMWFGIVWTILFTLEGIALALICAAWGARGRTAAIVMFAIQFFAALSWTPVFFTTHEMTLSLYLLFAVIVLVVITIALFWRVRKLAALLLLPYLAWICFATLLNYEFLRLNPDADGVEDPTRAVQRFEI